jgi:hypothetical protein
METPKEYYYTYYSYEEWGRGYFGSRKCNCLPEEDIKYFGSFSDKNFKPTQKIILKSDYATRKEAYTDEITLQRYYKVVENPHFVNRAYQTSTKFYCNILKNKQNKVGIFKMTSEELSKCGSKGGEKTFELKKGVFSISKEKRKEIAKKSGNKVKELGLGIFALTDKEKTEIGKKGYKTGLGKMSKEERSKIAKKVNSQKWKCLLTGYISNAGGLSRYQNKRNIDKSMREMV